MWTLLIDCKDPHHTSGMIQLQRLQICKSVDGGGKIWGRGSPRGQGCMCSQRGIHVLYKTAMFQALNICSGSVIQEALQKTGCLAGPSPVPVIELAWPDKK